MRLYWPFRWPVPPEPEGVEIILKSGEARSVGCVFNGRYFDFTLWRVFRTWQAEIPEWVGEVVGVRTAELPGRTEITMTTYRHTPRRR